MRIKIAILGSTGSIGKSLLKLVSKDKNKYEIVLLTANNNYKLLLSQAKKFNVKNIVINNKNSFINAKYLKKSKIKIFNNFENFKYIFTKKIDYVMSAIVGLDGLQPTYNIIPYTKKIAIANKETIICGWNIIKKQLKKYETEFIPVDSEHFSVWYALKNNDVNNLDKLYLTASGGPLLNFPNKKYKNLKISQITNHPNWNMGAKISVDSSTMINKVFEIIEAKKIFELSYDQISIIIHPKSYVHAIIKFNDGMIKIIAHDTTMDIPIFNSLKNKSSYKKIKTKNIDIGKLNNLNFSKINENKFPVTKILKKLPNSDSLFETIVVSCNDELVNLFLKQKISYLTLLKNLNKLVQKKEFVKYKFLEPKKITDILNLNKHIKTIINQNVNKL